LCHTVTNFICFLNFPVILEEGTDGDDNQDEWVHRNNNFSHDRNVNINVVGDESTLLEVPAFEVKVQLTLIGVC
jgi:hypothetical protein